MPKSVFAVGVIAEGKEGDRSLPAEWGGGRGPRFNRYPFAQSGLAIGTRGQSVTGENHPSHEVAKYKQEMFCLDNPILQLCKTWGKN